ncbi:MAG: ribbon-helix-helix protein, CopG family [Pseudomonadota bacterium]
MSKQTSRVQFELPEASMLRLKKLRDRTEASSYAEVVRRALQLYEALIEEVDAGAEISIKKEEAGEVRYLPIF